MGRNQLLDGSICLSPYIQIGLRDEQYARQYSYESPPEFPLALPYSGIVHHHLGPNNLLLLKPFTISWSVHGAPKGIPPTFTSILHPRFATLLLAYLSPPEFPLALPYS